MKRKSYLSLFLIIVAMFMLFSVHAEAATTHSLILTLDANGGVFPKQWPYEESKTRTEEIRLDDAGKNVYSINLGTNGKPVWEGKTLIGWSRNKNAVKPEYSWQTLEEIPDENESWSDRKTMPLDGSITYLYAIWTDTYNIILDANGGDFGTNTDRYGRSTPIESMKGVFWYYLGNSRLAYTNNPNKVIKRNSDEIHKGWSADKNATKPEYSTWFDGLVLNSYTPKTLYAIYGKEGDKASDYGATDEEDTAETDKKTDSGSSTKPDSTTDTSVTNTKKATKITAPKKTYKAKTKVKKFTATLKDSNNKPIKNAKLTLKVNGKTYKATTNNSGKATFKITKLTKKGTFTAVIKHAGNNTYKATSKNVKIKVKK